MNDKKGRIIEAARELFKENGFKSTNISKITKKAGVATGTFYIYFSSKDEIFMEIYNEENKKLKESILEGIDLQEEPFVVMQKMMTQNYIYMTGNPILREWYNPEVSTRIEKAFRKSDGLNAVNFIYAPFLEVIKSWQEMKKMRSDIKPEMIMAIFEALVTVDTHKEEIGVEFFPAVMEYLSKFTMDGLTNAIQG